MNYFKNKRMNKTAQELFNSIKSLPTSSNNKIDEVYLDDKVVSVSSDSRISRLDLDDNNFITLSHFFEDRYDLTLWSEEANVIHSFVLNIDKNDKIIKTKNRDEQSSIEKSINTLEEIKSIINNLSERVEYKFS